MPKATLASLKSWLQQIEQAVEACEDTAANSESETVQEKAEAKAALYTDLLDAIQTAIDELESL